MAPLPIPSEITGERRRRISQTYTHLHNELDKDMEALRADYRRTHYFSARAIQGALKMVDEIEQGKRAVLHKLQQEEMDNHLTSKLITTSVVEHVG
ncbi:hypothetical protein A1Q1_07798 [Trichosporon asahii var. asahii CBS 2479]|uniref:Uncharacterized protein n=1 Tax=Trichosporon asahii var. asahii (strain ATCC 90039 / CBS 2479 / JCM 2466 / KCTC 7840 / NBRC 103889/ NCYC 2677 / UAMH 7654) TaxID=1186058 RepID=J6F230_TRIAS|nr:hypothetical protein A1Q1_07798 [Trichosporon asahii var. asahii CBS 2479]EJT51004.1 hypothetical protein A1Q1_07798 [Trichosporon asahii var. asahii CBS 2479]